MRYLGDNPLIDTPEEVDEKINALDVNFKDKKLQTAAGLDIFEEMNNSSLEKIADVVHSERFIKKPELPIISLNEGNFIGEITNSIFKLGEFYINTVTSTKWELYDIDNNIIWEETVTGAAGFSPVFNTSGLYKLRCRFVSGEILSAWSDFGEFFVNAPISTPNVIIEKDVIKNGNLVINGTHYVPVGHNETLNSVITQISTTPDFSDIVYNETSATEINIIPTGLTDNTDYYIRMKYLSSSYSSVYSATKQVRIVQYSIDDIIPNSFQDNSDNEYTIKVNGGNVLSGNLQASTTFGSISVNSDIITFSAPDVSTDTSTIIELKILDNNSEIISEIYTKVVNIIDINFVADQTLLYNSSNLTTELNKSINLDGVSVYLDAQMKIDSSKINILDEDNFANNTTQKIYIDSTLVDLSVGDIIEADNHEGFVIKTVTVDGSSEEIKNIKAVSCGGDTTLILKSDNSVWSTGTNNYGQLGIGSSTRKSTFTDTMMTAKSIHAAGLFSFIIREDDSLWATGYNGYGQLGLGHRTSMNTFTNTGITCKNVILGGVHTVVIKLDDTVWSTGNNGYGQLGLGHTTSVSTFTDTLITAKAVACGYNHTMAIKMDDTLWGTGYNGYGQLGLGDATNRSTFTDTLITAKAVACGDSHTMIIKTDDTVWGTGNNNPGCLGGGPIDLVSTFIDIGVTADRIICDTSCSVIQKDGIFYYSGDSYYYKFGTNGDTSAFTEIDITAKEISFSNHSAIIKDDGSMYVTGANSYGQLGTGTTNLSYDFIELFKSIKYFPNFAIEPETALSQVPTVAYIKQAKATMKPVLQNEGETDFDAILSTEIREDTQNVIDSSYTSTTQKIYIDNKLANIKPGDTMYSDKGLFTVSVVNEDGNLVATTDCIAVSCGYGFTLIIKEDNSVWGTGNNNNSQFGISSNSMNSVEKFINLNIDAKYISCGYSFTMIIKLDDTLWCAGNNGYGQLGLGDTTDVSTFTNTLITAKSVACGNRHTMIIKSDDTIWSVGYNYNGQLGLGDTTDVSTFTDTLITAKSIACGDSHTMAIKTDDTLWGTGYNGYGQLGLGDTTSRSTFTDTLITAKSVACGDYHTMAIKTDDTLWGTGYNGYGQLGLGDTTSRNTFTDTVITAKSVACGNRHTMAIKADNSLFSVGYNTYGQLGLKDFVIRSVFTYSGMTYNDNYSVVPTAPLSTVPTIVCPISNFSINREDLVLTNATYTAPELIETYEDLDFQDSQEVQLRATLQNTNTVTLVTGELNKKI